MRRVLPLAVRLRTHLPTASGWAKLPSQTLLSNPVINLLDLIYFYF
ncbi:hypothetical protein RINTHH_11720 [Richelia intracellularis HH01]|uniref:Uncharacterized protein n=1 Tax=Richelia intracellularis HH01 TaxID=1165094 RepID=M1WZ70_9NOST|nr:hypothetical protein RINTHH_11720 [Richelia intracellularis HH01]